MTIIKIIIKNTIGIVNMENYELPRSHWEKKGGIAGLFKGSQDFRYVFGVFFCLPYSLLIVLSLAFAALSGSNVFFENLSIFVPVILIVSILSLFVLIKNIKNTQSKLWAYAGMVIATVVIFERAIAIVVLLIMSLK